MNAVLLTHDAQMGLAELVHKKYGSLWPGHPLTFRIPFNGSADGPALTYLRAQPDCQLVSTPRSIGASVLGLLDGVPGEEWVFWCIDDRYPTSLDVGAVIEVVAGLDGSRWRRRGEAAPLEGAADRRDGEGRWCAVRSAGAR